MQQARHYTGVAGRNEIIGRLGAASGLVYNSAMPHPSPTSIAVHDDIERHDIEQLATDLPRMRDLIRWAVSRFHQAELRFAQGMPDALDEAVYLCLSALHLPPDFSERYFDCRLTRNERLRVLAYYFQRLEHRPAAYICQRAWFCGMDFHVDERVLIPRSPIAELIEARFSPWIDPERVDDVLDLCTGSGCIAIACAAAFGQARVVAGELSDDALAVAKINRERHGMTDRLSLVRSDLFEAIPERRYDIIVSNPPYVSRAEMQTLPEEFAFEPEMALEAVDDGMEVVVRLLQQARRYLADEGILLVEVGYSQPALEARFPDVPFLWLDFEFGGQGVFLLTAEQLDQYRHCFDTPDKAEV